MPVPRNTSSLLDKLKNAKVKPVKAPEKKTVTNEEETPRETGGVNAGREAAKLRQRAKKAEADLATVTAERDTLKSEVETLRPHAKLWNDHEHVQRSKLLETLPPELKSAAKSMSLAHLQLFAKQSGATGEKKGESGKAADLANETDLLKLQKTGDTKAINAFVERVKNGEITPKQPTADVKA